MSATTSPLSLARIKPQTVTRWRRYFRNTSLFLTALAVTLLLGVPLLYMVVSSFKPAPEMFKLPPRFFPNEWSLDGYSELVQLSNVPRAFVNGVVVSSSAAIIGVLLGVGLSYTITRYRMPGLRFFTYLILIVYILPGTLLVIPIYSVWSQLGLTEGILPLALTHVSFTLPFAVWMLRSYFAAIPLDLEDAALVDGANRAQAFLLIILPLARAGIIATFIFTFILSWNEVLFASILAASENSMVISTALKTILGERSWQPWEMVNAAGVVATVPVLIFFVFIQRQLVAGFTTGAIKG